MRFCRFGFHYFGWQIGKIVPGLRGVVGNLEGNNLLFDRVIFNLKIISMFDIIGIRFSTFSGTIRYKLNFRGPRL